jgi:NADH-quinone oxidoreductase subunit L
VSAPTSGLALKLYNLSQNRFYIDEFYDAIIVSPAVILARISAFVDAVADGLIDVIGAAPGWLGAALRPIQNGLVQFYALAMILGLTVFVVILTLRAAP